MNTAEEIFKDQPESITPSIQMDEPNAPILIYEGDFELKKGSDIIKLQGKIKYVWFPSKGAIFQGTVISFSGANYREIINGSEHLDLCFNGSDIGKCFITGYTLSDADRLNGVMVRSAVTGQKTVPVSTVKFVIPNFISFIGTPIKTRSAKSFHSSNGRITLRNEIYEIIIDKAVDYKERQKLLDSKGGYLNLYYGQITKLNGTIIHEELDDVLSCFSYYLSFLNGAKCSPFFLSGMTGDKVTWRDFSNRSIAPYKQKITWPYTNTTKGLNELWNKMYALWQDKSAKDFLSKAIDWYVETNSGASFVEGHIVMAQTDLELIYNWLLVETNELLIGKDASNIAASNKIRLLLAHIKVDKNIPPKFTNLLAIKEFIDGPDAITQIRNAIIHSQEEKRKKLDSMDNMTKYEALQLGIWYIEMALLSILEFKETYFNRCTNYKSIPQREYAPWVKTELI